MENFFLKIGFGLIFMVLPLGTFGFWSNRIHANHNEVFSISKNDIKEGYSWADTIIETAQYYRNGNINRKTYSFYDQQGTLYKVSEEKYRSDGSRKYNAVLDYGVTLLYQAKYAKNNQLIVEKFYTYNYNGTLLQIEINRNGNRTLKSFDVDNNGDPISIE